MHQTVPIGAIKYGELIPRYSRRIFSHKQYFTSKAVPPSAFLHRFLYSAEREGEREGRERERERERMCVCEREREGEREGGKRAREREGIILHIVMI